MPRYRVSGSNAEIDFIVQIDDNIFPVEVKAGVNLQAKSLRVYRDKYKPPFCDKIIAGKFPYEWLHPERAAYYDRKVIENRKK